MKNIAKILVFIVAVALVFGALSVSAFAAGSTGMAKVDGAFYTNLDDAIAVANGMSGDVVVEIYGKLDYSNSTPSLTGSYDSISFVGKDASAEISITRNGSNGYISGNGNDCAVNFSGLVLSKPAGSYAYDAGYMNMAFSVYRVGSVSYDNCSFPNGACASGCSTTYTECTFEKSHEKYAVWAYGSDDITIENCKFDDDRGIKMYAEGGKKTTAITVTNCDFSQLTGKPAIVATLGDSIVLSGNTYSATGTLELEDNGSSNGIKVTSDALVTCVSDTYPDGCGVLVDGKIYRTVADAAQVATIGSTATLLYSTTEAVKFENDVVIDANGFEAPNLAIAALPGSGTVADPYVIGNLKDLKEFRDDVNAGNTYKGKYVSVTADIDLGGEEWTPIGNSSISFQGIFDANENTISNLVINGGSSSNIGFFGYTTDGEVKNLTIENAKVSGRLNVAVVAGTPYTTKYTNIKVTGHVEVKGMAYVGGVGGKNAYANWTNITVDVDDTSFVFADSVENGKSYRTYVGGVIGFNGEGGHTFTNISSNIKVEGTVCDIGGIFGIAHYSNKFENITFTGSVEAPEGAEEVGGIAGVWHNEKGTVVTFSNCVSTGTVTVGETTTTGSIVGGAYNASNVAPNVSGSLVIDGAESWAGIAKVGNTYYATLAEALEAAKGELYIVIDLIADATLDITSWQTLAIGGELTKTITINGNGFTLTFNKLDGDWNNIATNNDAKLILNNMTITDSGKNNGPWNRYDHNFACDVELNNVVSTKPLAFKADAVLNNVTVNDESDVYAIWIQPNGQTISINELEVNAGRGIKIDEQYVEAPVVVELSVENAKFTTAKKAAIVVKCVAGATITTNNVDISGVAADSENLVWVDEDSAVDFGKVTVNGELAFIEGGAESYEVYVSINGVKGYYVTLSDAIVAANGTTITLLDNAELGKTAVIPVGVEVTIDLAGYIISGVSPEAKASAVIENKGTLTITDSVGGGKITSKALNPDDEWGGEGQLAFPSYANNTIVNKGTLVLESGIIENTSPAGGATYAIDNYAGTITINGGKVYCENNMAIRLFANNTAMGITVNGGEIEGKRAIWIQLPSSDASIAPKVDVTVTGGTLSGRQAGDYYLAIYSYNYGNDPKNVTLNISGGIFNGDIALTGGTNKSSVETLNISGGTFNGEIYSYGSEDLAMAAIKVNAGTFASDEINKYTIDGFKVVANVSNGTYCVVAADETPVVGENGNWWIGGADTGLSAGTEIDLTPYIGANGNWWIGDTDLGIPANGGEDNEGTEEEKPGTECPDDSKDDDADKNDKVDNNEQDAKDNKIVVITLIISTVCICLTLVVILYRGIKRRSWWCLH